MTSRARGLVFKRPSSAPSSGARTVYVPASRQSTTAGRREGSSCRAPGGAEVLGPAALAGACGMLEAARRLLPVHDRPPAGEVLVAPVLVLEVVGVLPDVTHQDGEAALHRRAVVLHGRVQAMQG